MKAIALISGGLDSLLAARFMQRQGIEILPLKFKIPFLHKNKEGPLAHPVEGLKTVDLSEEFLKILISPAHGYGANLNPCIDCKILMLSKAKELMPQLGAEFIITGEVLGQRPMSQNKAALDRIAEVSGLEGLLVRPLSAKLLKETIPEKQGWIKRGNLLAFNGRNRKPQMELAKSLGIKDYSQPAGGCLLTDPEFSRRLKDLLSHQELNLNNLELLKISRHFRISQKTKLVVGRDEQENGQLMELARDEDYLFWPNAELTGPTALGRGIFDETFIKLACSIVCRYCDLNGAMSAEIAYKKGNEKEERIRTLPPAKETQLQRLRI